MAKIVDVHIGEVKIAKRDETLKAILGSCVGIGIIWKSENRCGLAHCLLPKSPTRTMMIGGRFVDQALLSLLALMKVRPENYADVDVVLAGGGNMTDPLHDPSEKIGTHNFNMALQETKRLGLRVVHADGFGDEGRKIFIDARTLSYRIEKIPRMTNAV